MLLFRVLSAITLCAKATFAAPGVPLGRVCEGVVSDSEVATAEAHFLAHANTTALDDEANRKSDLLDYS